ncbi:MAG TPA: DUF4097 family beta strand repeat-containing protein [Candidatus Angelobacter sp.]
MQGTKIMLAFVVVTAFAIFHYRGDQAKVQAAGLVLANSGAPAQADHERVVVAADADQDTDSDAEAQDDHDSDSDSDMPLHEEETINRTFALGAGARTLDVDNISGSIEVMGGQSGQAQLVVKKTIRAESKANMEAAKKEVTLDITEQPDLLKFYVNGPFRCNCNDGCSGWHGDRGYSVRMDFQLRVPRNIDLKLKTVNGGFVNVRNITGKFSVNNVNGKIEMQDISGSGRARTVNGSVKVAFRENPRENSEFSTVNGDVDLRFVKGLSADFRFKTFNGEVFSDFEMTSLPARNSSVQQHNGKFTFRTDRSTGGRVGAGGPEIKAENLNGSIRVLENHE